jgi:hypothetical protein
VQEVSAVKHPWPEESLQADCEPAPKESLPVNCEPASECEPSAECDWPDSPTSPNPFTPSSTLVEQPSIDQGPIPPVDEPTETAPPHVECRATALTAVDHLLCAWCPVCSNLLLIRHQPKPNWSFLSHCIPDIPTAPASILLPVLCCGCVNYGHNKTTILMSPTLIQHSCMYHNLQNLFPRQEPICILTCCQIMILVGRDTLFKELPPDSHMIGLDPRVTTERDMPPSQMLLPYVPSGCV